MRGRWLFLGACGLAVLLAWSMRPAAPPAEPVNGAEAEPGSVADVPAVAAEPGDPAAQSDVRAAELALAADPETAAPPDPLLASGLPPAEALRRLEWCGQLVGPDPTARFEANWRWLGEDAAKLERERYAQARAWMIERCGPWVLADGERARMLREEWVRRATRSADPADQLRALALATGAPGEADAIAARRQLETALAGGRPELLRDIGRVLERSPYGTPELLGPYAGGGASVLFALLACDLGMPCGADSEPVRASCALSGLCGYADYESLLFDARLGERAAALVRQHRALLLQRIRSGDVAGLFDPVPLPPPPG